MTFPARALGWCFLAMGIGVLWLLIAFTLRWTRAAVAPREAPSAAPARSAPTAPEGAPAALSGPTPTVARALLTPDCPSLDSEWWGANPTEPLAPSEVVRWRGIVAHYEWVAPTAVVPGGES